MSAVLLQNHREHKRRAQGRPSNDEECKNTEPENKSPEKVQENASWRGFVLIPDQGELVKLPVHHEYSLGSASVSANGAGGRLLPVYAIFSNRKVLQKHFPWLGRFINKFKSEDLLDEPEMALAQAQIWKQGHFGFWIVKGRNCYVNGDRVIMHLLKDAFLKSDYAGVDNVFLTGVDGLPVEKLPVEQFTGDDDLSVKTIVATGAHASAFDLALLLREDPDLSGVDPKRLLHYLEPNMVQASFEKLHGNIQIGFSEVIAKALQYVIDSGVDVEVDKYPDVIANGLSKAKLKETSFSALLGLTQNNGGYRFGGLRKVSGRWVIDPSVTGRIDNSRYIVVSMPTWRLGSDGFPVMSYICRSRPDRNTTGLKHSGFIKVVNKGGLIKRVLGRYLPQFKGNEPDVQVFCDCPDFKYRFHWVLSKLGAAAAPNGAGGQAINSPPNKTNPSFRPSLCKHLAACEKFIDYGNASFRKLLRQVSTSPVQTTSPKSPPILKKNVVAKTTTSKTPAVSTVSRQTNPPEASSVGPQTV